MRIPILALVLTLGSALPPLGAQAAELPASGAPVAGAPRIHCPDMIQDIGTVPRGSIAQRLFTIENRGTAPLVIESVQPSCDCTTAPLTERVIQPGRFLPLLMRFDSTKFDGSVEKTVLLQCNDPERPNIVLVMKGVVDSPYLLEPSELQFEPMSSSRGGELKLTLRRKDGRAPALRGAAVAGQTDLPVRTRKLKGGRVVELSVQLPAGAPPRTLETQLVLELADARLPRLELPLRGRITPDLEAHPAQLDFGSARPGAPLLRRLLLSLNDPSLVLRSVEVEPPCLVADPQERGSFAQAGAPGGPRGVDLRLKVAPGTPPGPVKGRIVIRSSGAVLEVPFQGNITE